MTTIPPFNLEALTPLKRYRRYLPKRLKLPGLSVLCLIVGVGLGWYLAGSSFTDSATMVPLTLDTASINVCFSPQGQCEQAIVHQLKAARLHLHLQVFTLTSKVITQALLEAHHRGIEVAIIYDPGQYQRCFQQLDELRQAGIKLQPYRAHPAGLAHNKVIIIDDHTVITGSYNFTSAAARRNAENVVIIHNQHLAQLYLDNWYLQAGATNVP